MKIKTVEKPTYVPTIKYLINTKPEMRGSSWRLGGLSMQSGSAGLNLLK